MKEVGPLERSGDQHGPRAAGGSRWRGRRFRPSSSVSCGALVVLWLMAGPALLRAAEKPRAPKKVAVITTVFYRNSHADVIAGRLLQSNTLDGKGEYCDLQVVSMYVDQFPPNDLSRRRAEEFNFRIHDTVAGALTLDSGQLAVDGVLLIAEHGHYPESPSGQVQFPKRRLFGEIVDVFRRSHRVVPVFSDKHLADHWEDAKWIYDTAVEEKIPLMAGSSLPVAWRHPPLDVHPDRPLAELLVISYHRLDSYGFHAMEIVQTLAERRRGGETGIRRVQCVTGECVWQAADQRVFSPELLDAALSRLRHPRNADRPLRDAVVEPILCTLEYADGLRAHVLTLNGRAAEWTAAWRYADDPQPLSTRFYVQDTRPFMHFTYLLHGVEELIHRGQAPWPVERTLMTSGALDAVHLSKLRGGQPLPTPYLNFSYPVTWQWRQPPPPPPDRPLDGP